MLNVKHVVGLTLSPAQARWINELPTPGVEVRVEDWRDHKTERPYDSVISVAAFEAFVHRGMEPAAKMAAYAIDSPLVPAKAGTQCSKQRIRSCVPGFPLTRE